MSDIKSSTTDGDAERDLIAMEQVDSISRSSKRWKLIKAALQTRTPPVPVDTISINREVLMGVREQIKDAQKAAIEMHDVIVKNSSPFVWEAWDLCLKLQKNIASLDAVLSEGK